MPGGIALPHRPLDWNVRDDLAGEIANRGVDFRSCRPVIRPGFRIGEFLTWCAAFLAVGCSAPGKPAVPAVEFEISPQPARVGPVTLTFKLADSGTPVAGAHVSLEADMSHPGMSPVFGQAIEIDPGRYQGKLEFGMAGDWVVVLHIELPGGRKLEQQIEVKGVRPD